MATRDLKSNVDVVTSIDPAAITATATGTGVDLRGYDSAMMVFHPGTVTDGTHTPTMEESDTLGSGYTTVATVDLQGTLAVLATDTIQRVGYIGSKRYIRAISTVSGTTTGGVYGVTVVRGNPHQTPLA